MITIVNSQKCIFKQCILSVVLLAVSIVGLAAGGILTKTGIRLSKKVAVFNPDGNYDNAPVSVSFNKNIEKRWYTEDHSLMGAQFDGVIYNNMRFTAVQNWTIVIAIPENCRLDPNPWNGEYSLNTNKLTICQPVKGDKSMKGKVADYIVEPKSVQTFGCIMYAPDTYMPERSKIVITYTPFVHPQLIPAFWVCLIICFTLFVIMVTYILVSVLRHKEMIRQQKLNQEYIETTLKLFANTIEAKDQYTKGHSERVSIYAREIARRMKLPQFEQDAVYHAAILHDVGKIGVPDTILNKPGKLTAEERLVMQGHAASSAKILEGFSYIADVANIARHHHERYDGKGYPDGFTGEKIPLLSRIICVADCFDAMTSDRCYRPKLDMEKVKKELDVCSGSQFDPSIVPIMIKMIDDGFAPIDKY